MFINDINPVLIAFDTVLGPLEIRYYGLVYAVSFLFAFLFLKNKIERKKIKNFDPEKLELFMIFLILGSIFFARIFEIIFYSPSYYLAEPIKMLFIWQGGLSFHGGLFGAIFVTLMFCKKNKIKVLEITDNLVIPLTFGLFLGRLANFTNSEIYGKITNSSLGVNFNNETNPQGKLIYRIPTQFLESAKNLIMFAMFNILEGKHFQKKIMRGTFTFGFLAFYGIVRFFIEFYKAADFYFIGLNIGQYLCLIMMIPGIVGLWKIYGPRSISKQKTKTKNKKR